MERTPEEDRLVFEQMQKHSREMVNHIAFSVMDDTVTMIPFGAEKSYLAELVTLWRVIFERPTDEKFVVKASDRPILVDPFCDPDILKKQMVFRGKTVSLIYNHRPVLGADHYLLVTHEHRTTIDDLTEEEFLEANELARRIIHEKNGFVIMYQKTGRAAGQTVDHWHQHLIFIDKKPETWFEKWKLFFQFLLRTRRLVPADAETPELES